MICFGTSSSSGQFIGRGGLKTYQIDASIESEDVLDDGLKMQYPTAVRVLVRRPDRLRVDASNDRQDRQYVYDGKQFTLWAPRIKLYATVPAPPSIGELVDALETTFGVEMPLADLFRWGTESKPGAGITAALDLGPSAVGGADCRHYAFRQEGLDWQIWIQNGDSPLPRKLVLTTTLDEARPQHQATYTWNLAPAVSDSDFAFSPPAGANPIAFDTAALTAGVATKEEK